MTNFSPIPLKLSRRFLKDLKKLDVTVRKQALKTLEVLKVNPSHPSLRLEPLSGIDDAWKVRINDNFRILMLKLTDEDGPYFLLTDLGKHDLYRRR